MIKHLKKNLFLISWIIDDAAEIYINGKLIAVSVHYRPIMYQLLIKKLASITFKLILNKNGKNLIAVRVYDSQTSGGIYSGDIGVFVSELPLDLLINLEGDWKFKTGDNIKWKETNLNDNSWNHLFVPLHWDSQGYKDYDGFAWYRLEFDVNLTKTKFLLI